MALLGLVALALGLLTPLLVWAVLDGPGESRAVVASFSGAESRAEVAEQLTQLGLISSPHVMRAYLTLLAPGVRVSPGQHLFRGGESPRKILQRLGRLPSRSRTRVTFPEGFTSLELAARLEERDVATRAAFLSKVRDPELLAELAIRAPSAEGFLFPATYELYVDSDPAQIVRLLAAETRKRLTRIDARNGGALAKLNAARSWGELEVLTLASMIEREARDPEERRLIASVFLNRLDDPTFRPARMLQSDPTAAYGCAVARVAAASCASFSGKVTPELLRDASNPFNTYRHPGLPPGPIANPGEGAIEAVLNPAHTDYLYFVADGRGRHRFSRSFDQHRRAVERVPDPSP